MAENKSNWKAKLKSHFTWKCRRCGEGLWNLASLIDHEAECKSEGKGVVGEKEHKNKSTPSGFKRFYRISPENPKILQFFAFLFGILILLGLFILIVNTIGYFLGIIERELMIIGFAIGILFFVFGNIFFYGVSRMKKWVLYLYGFLLFGGLALGVFIGDSELYLWQRIIDILIQEFFPIIIFGFLLWHRKKFS